MENQIRDFWNLIGNVSGTLSAFAFILMAFYYENLSKIIEEITKYNLKIYKMIHIQISILLFWLMLPFFQALLIIRTNGHYDKTEIVLLFSFAFYIVSLFYEVFILSKIEKIEKKYLIIRYFFIGIVFTIFIILYFKIEYEFSLELLSVLSMLTGFTMLLLFVAFYDKYKLIIDINNEFKDLISKKIYKLEIDKTKLENLYNDYKDVTLQYSNKKGGLSIQEENKIRDAYSDNTEINNKIKSLNDIFVNLCNCNDGKKLLYSEYRYIQSSEAIINIRLEEFNSSLKLSIEKAKEEGFISKR